MPGARPRCGSGCWPPAGPMASPPTAPRPCTCCGPRRATRSSGRTPTAPSPPTISAWRGRCRRRSPTSSASARSAGSRTRIRCASSLSGCCRSTGSLDCRRAHRSSSSARTMRFHRHRFPCWATSRRATAAPSLDAPSRWRWSGRASRGSVRPCMCPSTGASYRWRSPVLCWSTRKERAAMADTLERTSPLQPWAARFGQLPNSVAIVEEPFVTMVDLRVNPSGPGAAAAAEVLGVELPAAASTYAKNADTTVIWMGPDEWLVTGTAVAGPELEARLREAVAPHGGVAVDVSGQRTTLRLRGSASREGLGKGCGLDLHPRALGEGTAAQTMLGQAGVILLAVNGGGADYRILIRSSFARYLADWLLDAAAEYTPEQVTL